jgi:hypothetical protein
MGKEVLVLGGENRVADNRGDVLIRDDWAVACRLDQRLTVGVVDLSNGWKLKTGEWLEIGRLVRSK